METPVEAKLFINGKFVDASDKAIFDLHSPYSGELVGKSMLRGGGSSSSSPPPLVL